MQTGQTVLGSCITRLGAMCTECSKGPGSKLWEAPTHVSLPQSWQPEGVLLLPHSPWPFLHIYSSQRVVGKRDSQTGRVEMLLVVRGTLCWDSGSALFIIHYSLHAENKICIQREMNWSAQMLCCLRMTVTKKPAYDNAVLHLLNLKFSLTLPWHLIIQSKGLCPAGHHQMGFQWG